MSEATTLTGKRGVILFGHGSPVKEANDLLKEVARNLRESSGYGCVVPSFLEFDEMDLAAAVGMAVAEGCNDIIVAPYFLYSGSHIKKDLPRLVEEARRTYPSVTFTIARSLEYDRKLVDVALERIEEAIAGAAGPQPIGGASESITASRGEIVQHPIEKESFRIIEETIGETDFTGPELSVVKRVIHATADFDFKDLLRFSPGAMGAGMEAASIGANIVTDVRMVEVGVNTARLTAAGITAGRVVCFSSDREVARLAKERGTTRTAAAMEKARKYLGGAIVVIGNAPTALRELLRIVGEGGPKPALVIGTPVGFVGAEESKNELVASGLEYITCVGRKGGSPVAVAAVNAVVIEAVREAVKAAAVKAPAIKIVQ